jgi:hypothetical protein
MGAGHGGTCLQYQYLGDKGRRTVSLKLAWVHSKFRVSSSQTLSQIHKQKQRRRHTFESYWQKGDTKAIQKDKLPEEILQKKKKTSIRPRGKMIFTN